MAGEAGQTNWRAITVPDSFVTGTQFYHWSEDGTGSIVRLRIDKDGYILWWTDAVSSESVSLFSVVDVRCGRFAKHPKDAPTITICDRFVEAFAISQSYPVKSKRFSSSKISISHDQSLSLIQSQSQTQPQSQPQQPPPQQQSQSSQSQSQSETNGSVSSSSSVATDLSPIGAPPSTDLSRDAIEACAVSVFYGADSVNPNCVNFIAPSSESAKEWSKFILELSMRSLAVHGNMVNFLELAYKELSITHSERGKIPLKLLYRKFGHHRDDQDKVDKVLEACGLPADKSQSIRCADLTSEAYHKFIKMLLQRNDVENVFISLGAQTKPYVHITAEQFADFLNKEQRDPRLNEVLHPLCTISKAEELIRKYEPTTTISNKRHLSVEGFYEFLISDDNNLTPYELFESSQDMSQPMAHYFINSSHNTYLTGHQLTGKSSVEYYRYVLLTGCRCIELDCWNGDLPDEEPKITHGFTMVTQILYKDVIDMIAVSAFEVSDYPLILSFENHCSAKQQVKMVQYMKATFGDMLLAEPLASHPLEPGVPLPSPSQLRRKIIVKSKKHFYSKEKKNSVMSHAPRCSSGDENDGFSFSLLSSTSLTPTSTTVEEVFPTQIDVIDNDGLSSGLCLEIPVQRPTQGGPSFGSFLKPSATDSRLSSKLLNSDDGNIIISDPTPVSPTDAVPGAIDSQLLAALVNYVDPIPFESFAQAESRQCSFESSSFAEAQALQLLKMFPVEFVHYNKSHLSRIYPKGTRVDSSNFMPLLFWAAGAQMAALNFQTSDLSMQLNAAMFEQNGRCGYVMKPEIMRRLDRSFDPFAQRTVDGIVAASLTVKVISGQFLSDRKVSTFIEIETYGIPHDTRRKQRTKIVPNNALNPVYEDKEFEFAPIIVPHLAFLRLAAFDETGRLLGQRTLPVSSLRPGYRHIPLRNELNQPAGLAALFVRIRICDYVPTLLADFAEALANPIAHQQQVHLREQQIAVLTDELVDEEDETGSGAVELRRKNTSEKGSLASPTSPVVDSTPPEPASRSLRPPALVLSRGAIREALLSPIHFNGRKFSDFQTNSAPCSRRKSNTDATMVDANSLSLSKSPGESPDISRLSLNTSPDKSPSVSGNKILQFQDVGWKDMLPDSSVFDSDKVRLIRTITDLKNVKEVQKLCRKLEKECSDLAKRYDKNRQSLFGEYGMLNSVPSKATEFARRVSATVNAITLARSAKSERRKGVEHDISVDFDSAPAAIHHLVDLPTRASLPLRSAHFALRGFEIDRQYVAEVGEWRKTSTGRLTNAMNSVLEEKFRTERLKLDGLYEQEMLKMQDKQDKLRREVNKQLARDVPNKADLSRSRQEILQRHIHYGVMVRQQLLTMYERERDRLLQKQAEVKGLVEEASENCLETICSTFVKRPKAPIVTADDSSDL